MKIIRGTIITTSQQRKRTLVKFPLALALFLLKCHISKDKTPWRSIVAARWKMKIMVLHTLVFH